MLLVLRQLGGDRDAGDHVQIALAAARHVRHALAAEFEARAWLGAGRNVQVFAPVKRRHLDASSERKSGEADRHLAEQIIALAMKEMMVLHVDDDVEVPGRAAGAAVFALVLKAQALPRRDPGGNLHRELAFPGYAARAAARLTRLGDGLAGAAAVRARARDGEEALLIAELPGAPALIARFGRCPRRGAGSATRLARLFARDLNRRLGAGRGFLEADLEVVAQVGATLRPAATPASAEDVAKPERVPESREDIGEVGEDRRVESLCAGTTIYASVSKAVVQTALLAIGEDGVRLGRFLEAFLGLAVVRIPVGMVLQRELSILALDLLVRRLALDAKDLLVIALTHGLVLAGPHPRSLSLGDCAPRSGRGRCR